MRDPPICISGSGHRLKGIAAQIEVIGAW